MICRTRSGRTGETSPLISIVPPKRSDFDGVQPWHGLRPVSPDGLPYVGRFASHPNLLAACGHAMLGVTLGPITGQLIAEIISGRKTSVALATLNPHRFA